MQTYIITQTVKQAQISEHMFTVWALLLLSVSTQSLLEADEVINSVAAGHLSDITSVLELFVTYFAGVAILG